MWEQTERFGNFAAMPLTFLGYVALAESIWPRNVGFSGGQISWPAVTAVILVLVGLATVVAQVMRYRTIRRKEAARPLEQEKTGRRPTVADEDFQRYDQWLQESLIVRENQTFANQRVRLDGYLYQNCTFRDVVFTYDGTEPFDFVACNFEGDEKVETTVHDLQAAIRFLKEIAYVRI